MWSRQKWSRQNAALRQKHYDKAVPGRSEGARFHERKQTNLKSSPFEWAVMGRVPVLENDSVSLWRYEESRIVHHEFHGHIWGEHFRQTLELGARVFETYGANSWLSDERANCSLPFEDADWARTVWFPRVQRAGWKNWAIVLPKHVIGQMNMKRLISIYSALGISTQTFEDPDTALRWLRSAQ